MKTDTQFSVFLVNKPGVLAQVCHALAADKINIVAMTMMDSMEHGVLRMVVADAKAARTTISKLGVPSTETDVILAELPHRPGALADFVGRLADAHVNVNYAYCTTGAANGKTIGVFKVSDPHKAGAVLMDRKPKRRGENGTIRAQPAIRRR